MAAALWELGTTEWRHRSTRETVPTERAGESPDCLFPPAFSCLLVLPLGKSAQKSEMSNPGKHTSLLAGRNGIVELRMHLGTHSPGQHRLKNIVNDGGSGERVLDFECQV